VNKATYAIRSNLGPIEGLFSVFKFKIEIVSCKKKDFTQVKPDSYAESIDISHKEKSFR
jgi:hypothetical protein